jgi:hypothetical protein
MHLRETGDRITRIAEELDSIRDRAAVLQDQVAGQRQEQLNSRLLVLSLVSAFFLPLTFVTGLLGMNLEGIPFSHEEWSFPAVVALTFVLGVALLGFLKMAPLDLGAVVAIRSVVDCFFDAITHLAQRIPEAAASCGLCPPDFYPFQPRRFAAIHHASSNTPSRRGIRRRERSR